MKKITVPQLLGYKRKEKKIAMITAYDATFASLFDKTDIDIVLVGDSLGMVVQGQDSTVPVTLEDIIYHCRCVSRSIKKAHICADLPFMSTRVSVDKTVEDAATIIQKGRAESVKIEGGQWVAGLVKKIVDSKIPVMGHIGMTPQGLHCFGGFKTQGKKQEEALRIIEDAKAIEEAGAFSIVIEGVPASLASEISAAVKIPTIGIGAGPHCDGQVLVCYDLLGMNDDFNPSFLKKYANLSSVITDAVSTYSKEVKAGVFPENTE